MYLSSTLSGFWCSTDSSLYLTFSPLIVVGIRVKVLVTVTSIIAILLNKYSFSLFELARVVSPSLISLKVTFPRACTSAVKSFMVNPREITENVSLSSADIPMITLSNLSSNL